MKIKPLHSQLQLSFWRWHYRNVLIHYSAGLVIDVAKLHLHLAFSSFAPIQFTRELLSVKLVLILLVYLLALFYVFFIYLDCNAFFMNSIVFYCFFFLFLFTFDIAQMEWGNVQYKNRHLTS